MLALGGLEAVLLMAFFWLVSAWVFYMIIKAAVRNGMLEADEVREGRRRRDGSRPYVGPTSEALRRRVDEGRTRDTLDD
ncbi:hypothetical protein [Nocardioides jiangxiensis]|uniref:SHOCT domain-containing protein n=1 Tax=Nocardioides jiangxiensis TaxID=3064524 RepID=A0ABT9B5C6_9ACTN|nr:hypothetical protein [Nocardioides sp. WY-20]MDO7869443.1 hypothetical protein [Nocardioides sp. WY-20]